jgi:hypothetical protein
VGKNCTGTAKIRDILWLLKKSLNLGTNKSQEIEGGWYKYEVWKKELSSYKRILEHQEKNEEVIESLLTRAFLRGYEKTKLNKPLIQTVLLYIDNLFFKFQRISGDRVSLNLPDIYMPAKPSLRKGSVTSFCFEMVKDRICEAYKVSHGQWKQIPDEPVDCLIIAKYEKAIPKIGDYFFIDIPKYLAENKKDGAKIDLWFMSDKTVSEISLWEMKGYCSQNNSIPLCFKECQVNKSLFEKNNFSELLDSSLIKWFELLDEELKKTKKKDSIDEDALELLKELKNIIQQKKGDVISFTDFIQNESFEKRFSIHENHRENGLILLYLWSS